MTDARSAPQEPSKEAVLAANIVLDRTDLSIELVPTSAMLKAAYAIDGVSAPRAPRAPTDKELIGLLNTAGFMGGCASAADLKRMLAEWLRLDALNGLAAAPPPEP